MKNNGKQLIEVIEDALVGKPRPYSGRGMRGEKCVGVSVEKGYELRAIVSIVDAYWRASVDDLFELEALLSAGLDTDPNDFGVEFGRPRMDALGTDTILYWPDVAWPEDEDTQEGEPK